MSIHVTQHHIHHSKVILNMEKFKEAHCRNSKHTQNFNISGHYPLLWVSLISSSSHHTLKIPRSRKVKTKPPYSSFNMILHH